VEHCRGPIRIGGGRVGRTWSGWDLPSCYMYYKPGLIRVRVTLMPQPRRLARRGPGLERFSYACCSST